MEAIDFVQLDHAKLAHPRPDVFSRNLSALGVEQPEFAAEIEKTDLPTHWRFTRTLDGAASFRTEPPGAPTRWLAETAAPDTRAAAVLKLGELVDKNPATPCIAAGAELRLLLQRLSPRQAVFVFETELASIAAVLRLIDVADAIETGRCVIVPPNRERDFLTRLLRTHSGLLPPGAIVPLPGVTADRLRDVQSICEETASATIHARQERISQIRAGDASPIASSAPRLAALALGGAPTIHNLAKQLAAAATQLGWNACDCVSAGPRDIHPLPHCIKLATFKPSITINIGHDSAPPPINALGLVCQWHTDARNAPETISDTGAIHLAATPRIADLLKEAGAPGARVHDFYRACPPELNDPAPIAPHAPVLLVGDLPNADAKACGVEQPTHKRLWAALRDRVAAKWDTREITRPGALLRTVEGECGVELADRGLRRQMIRIIEYVLIPAVVLERIFHTLTRERRDALVAGAGWDRLVPDESSWIARSCDDLRRRAERPDVSAAVFAGLTDPLQPALLDAAAIGWPVLIHSPGDESLRAGLGGMLQRQQHYEQFSGPKDLLARLQATRDKPNIAERRRDRAREHLSANHTYSQRLSTLARELGLTATE